MGMFEHRQRFAAIHLHGEFGRELMKARGGFQRLQQLRRQGTGIKQHQRINASRRTEHQVAYIVPCCIAWAQARRQ
ncbi:hypothetical protein D3C77_493260 [compost metagenome]